MGNEFKSDRGKQNRDLTAEQSESRERELLRQHEALQSYLKAGHAMPRTRREFLASGVLGLSGFIAGPSLLELVLRSASAHAQEVQCPDDNAAAAMMPFVTLNLSGGAALMANFVPHHANGDPLPSYSIMGLGNPANFQIVREFGNVPFPSVNNVLVSKFLEGLRAGAANPAQANAATALEKTAFVGVCIRTQDDTSNNMQSLAGLVAAAGLAGTDLPNMGTRNTNTGVGQLSAGARPPAPLIVNNFNDVQGALATSGILTQQLADAKQRESLLTLVQKLSSNQRRQLASHSSAQTLGKLVECATGKNIALMKAGTSGIDPRQDANIALTWGLQANTNNADTVRAALAFNALNGKAGSIGIEMGGYDYHGNNRATTDQRDRDAGVVVGRILRTAEIMNRPVFIHVTSDGAVSSPASETPDASYNGDRGSAGMSYMIVFHPNGRPATDGFQIGSFTNAQAADDQFISNWIPERAALAVFANYLKLNDKLSVLDQLSNRAFDSTQLGKVLKFA